MTVADKVIVELQAKWERFNADTLNGQRRFETSMDKIARSALRAESQALRSSTAINRAMGAIGTALGVREILQYADAWTQAGNMLRAAATSAGVQTRSLNELNKSANAARTGISDYVDLYARLIRSASAVAKSEDEIALATDLVSKAFKAGGASAQEQAAGILQLGQALGSGVLQGDELRSIRENAPVIAKAIADEFKTTVAGLKKLGEDGELTSERVFRAIINAQKPIEAQFKVTNATISDSFTLLKNNLTQYIGQTTEAYGVTQTINGILSALAGNIGAVANAAAAAAIVLISQYIPALARATAAGAAMIATNPFLLLATAIGAAAFAITAFGDEIHPVAGELANLHDYAAAAWEGVKSGATEAAEVTREAMLTVVNFITKMMDDTKAEWSDVGSFVTKEIDGLIGAFRGLVVETKVIFSKLPSAIAEYVIDAMNTMIAGIEKGLQKALDGINSVSKALNNVDSFFGFTPILNDNLRVDLGRIENTYKGAGKVASDAWNDALKEGDSKYFSEYLERLRQQANQRAKTKPNGSTPEIDRTSGFGGGVPTDPDDKKKKKGRTKKTPEEKFDGDLQRITDRTAALVAETEAQRQINPLIDDYGYAMEKARTEQELLNAAQKAGVAITPELRAQISQTAEQWALASAEANKLAEAQDKIRQRAEEWQDASKDATRGFVDDLMNGVSAAEALANALDKVLDKLLDMAFDDIFTSIFKGSGGGGLLSFLGLGKKDGGIIKAATGGYIRGAGGPRSDSIPAMLSNGEYVINAAATKKFGPLLDRINSGHGLALTGGGMANLSAPTMPVLSPQRQSSGGGSMRVDVGVSVDNNGNLQAFVRDVSRQESASTVKAYDKSGPMRFARDSKQATRRGLVR